MKGGKFFRFLHNVRCLKLSGARAKKSFNGMADYSQGGGMGEWKIVGLEGPAHCKSL